MVIMVYLNLKSGKTIRISGSGAQHQNGMAERSIQTVICRDRTMLFHAVVHWPKVPDLQLWPFALPYPVFLWIVHPNPEIKLSLFE